MTPPLFAVIERAFLDPGAPLPAEAVMHFFTSERERHASGALSLGARCSFALDSADRYDLFVLAGEIRVDELTLTADAFASLKGPLSISAGEDGARVLIYRDSNASGDTSFMSTRETHAWRDARAPNMRVATLPNPAHTVSIVAWEIGARTREHTHAYGEELFVLSGELRSQEERYPAGTWLRFHPGAKHEPYALKPTRILLRNGHLT